MAHAATDLTVPPELPADRLAGDPDLAARTREAAPSDRRDSAADPAERELGAVEAFLADDEKIEAIQRQAREEAATRAQEWGFDD
ncbi:hypothetical protein [Haladaptatus sp. DYSN1]|uniref:hypothetical protein n=1 Tax=unclassified Haladaptatus TaxID=2622732 RepID=UPI002407712E|nr:hypothetical protein [Haladaptatus sp. DYSN1]